MRSSRQSDRHGRGGASGVAVGAKQVLFVSYLFPPLGGGGVQRTAKFVKYLPEHGWQPVVLTGPAAGSLRDPSLEADVPADVRVVRVRGAALSHHLPWRLRHWLARWLLVVDEQIGWLPFAVRQGRRLAQEVAFRAMYSTSGPYTDHLVALRLKRATGLPWVADFRDPWLDNESAAFPTRLHRVICSRLERDVVCEADRVLVVSQPLRAQLLNRYPDLSPGHVVALPNGFDPADFEHLQPAQRDQRLNLVYTGSLYGTRSARVLMAALRRSIDSGSIPSGEVILRLVGNTGKEAAELVAEWELADVVDLVGYLPHRDVLAHQLAADVLLLIIGPGPGSEGVLTAKLFEYLAAGKPILALVPPGAAASLLEEARAGFIVPPDDVEAIARALAALFADWKAGRLPVAPDAAVVARYDRRVQAGRLAGILDDIAAHVSTAGAP